MKPTIPQTTINSHITTVHHCTAFADTYLDKVLVRQSFQYQTMHQTGLNYFRPIMIFCFWIENIGQLRDRNCLNTWLLFYEL